MAIYTFYKREREFMQVVTSDRGPSGNRYIRLMALSATEILGTIPLGTYFIVYNAKMGVEPWKSWADTHNHYSTIYQFPGIIRKNDPNTAIGLEMFRWLLVACAIVFFLHSSALWMRRADITVSRTRGSPGASRQRFLLRLFHFTSLTEPVRLKIRPPSQTPSPDSTRYEEPELNWAPLSQFRGDYAL
jgi:hypothetical protein